VSQQLPICLALAAATPGSCGLHAWVTGRWRCEARGSTFTSSALAGQVATVANVAPRTEEANLQNETLISERTELQMKLNQAHQDLRSQAQALGNEKQELQAQLAKVANERNVLQGSDSQLLALRAKNEKLRAELEESKQNLDHVQKRESEAALYSG
jgi:predicted RNase H-like nuclease (RuvC/YqgF family)